MRVGSGLTVYADYGVSKLSPLMASTIDNWKLVFLKALALYIVTTHNADSSAEFSHDQLLRDVPNDEDHPFPY